MKGDPASSQLYCLAVPHLQGRGAPSIPRSTSTCTDDSLLPHVYAIALYNKERAPDTAEWDMAVSPPSIPRPLFHTA